MGELRFPNVTDTPLARAPLAEVVCQVRFPPILRLAESLPIDFQDVIRDRFPGFEEEEGFTLRIDTKEGRPLLGAEQRGRVFKFESADKRRLISLSTEFYALTSKSYTVWTDFAADLQMVHDAVIASVRPVHATRIGLRYVNIITADNSGLSSLQEMAALVHPQLMAPFRSDAWDLPMEMSTVLVLSDGEARMILRASIAPPGSEPSVTLDFDYFVEGQQALEDVVNRCTGYHDVIYKAFRWCLPGDSFHAFGPMPSEGV